HLPTDRLIADCIAHNYSPLLIGRDPHDVLQIWEDLYRFPPVQWVGRSGITHLALSAVDIALWDIKAQAAGVPLWKLLGGGEKCALEAYNTDGGWLNWPLDVLVSDCRRLVEEVGFRGIKIKVGSSEPGRDLERIEAVRRAIGPRIALMIDANGRFDLPGAVQLGRRLAEF